METDKIVLCDLGPVDYEDVLALWQRAGLHIRVEGRDAPEAFAAQIQRGCQRVVGLRVEAGRAEGGSGKGVATEGAPEEGAGGGALVAVAVLTHDGRKGWINRLAVDPGFRRRGLAQQLIVEAERWFTEDAGLEVWAALIERQNQASRSLFDRAGYRPLDVVYVTKRTREDA